MADHREVMGSIKKNPLVSYPVLTPNIQGFEAAVRPLSFGTALCFTQLLHCLKITYASREVMDIRYHTRYRRVITLQEQKSCGTFSIPVRSDKGFILLSFLQLTLVSYCQNAIVRMHEEPATICRYKTG